MKKSFIALILALCMLCSCAMAETALIESINTEPGYPIVNSPVSVSIALVAPGGSVDFSAERNWMCQYIDKYSGLEIDWTIIDSSAANERIALMLNSGDMPDAILGKSFNVNDIVQYGMTEGMFRPINDLLVYAPNLTAYLDENPSIKSAITAPDGNIYGFPNFANIWSYDVRFFVQTSWLETVGVEMPTTLAEFKDMLIAFRDNDVNGNGDATDEIPWVGAWADGQNERRFIFNALGYVSSGSNLAIDYTGDETQIIYMPYAEKYKDFLIYMNDLWNEGLLDPDMFTQAETQVQATVLEGVTGFCGQSAPYVYDPEHQDEWCAIAALTDDETRTPVWPAINPVMSPAILVINADADEEVAAALTKFADECYTLDWYVYATYGPEAGSELDWNGDGHYYSEETGAIAYNRPDDMTSDWTHRITNLTIWSMPGFNCNGYAPYKIQLGQERPDTAVGYLFRDGDVSRLDEVQQQQAYSPYYVEQVPNLFFSAEDLERINELVTPLDDYVASMEAKFITGEISIEEGYDEFIATLESYGVEEFIGLYQQYYAAYKAA